MNQPFQFDTVVINRFIIHIFTPFLINSSVATFITMFIYFHYLITNIISEQFITVITL